MTRRGVFIVLEGGEGAGKTAALAVLASALEDDGHTVLATREPGGTQEGLALRALLLSAASSWEPGAELLLMTAARAQHVRRVILPALERGTVVLCDRFVGSTIAYQGAGRALPEADILDLHRRFAGDLFPDLTVLLDVPPLTGLARSRHRLGEVGADEGRFEALDLAFHERVRQSFLSQATGATIILDAGDAIDRVHASLIRQVRHALACRALPYHG